MRVCVVYHSHTDMELTIYANEVRFSTYRCYLIDVILQTASIIVQIVLV